MTSYEAQILKSLHLLEKSQQNTVLSYVKSLLKNQDSKKLLKFAGAFAPSDIKEMETAIQQDCEMHLVTRDKHFDHITGLSLTKW